MPMEPSNPAVSPWGRRESPCAIHGMGTCPYPVAQWQPVFSSPSDGEGEEEVVEEEEEEDEAAREEEEDDVVVVAIVDKDDKPVGVILVPESTPPRSPYKKTTRIRIGPQGRPTGTLAPREGAREANPNSPEVGSAVWPPPPPLPSSGPITTTPPPPSSGDSSTAPPLMSNHHSGAPSGAESFATLPTSRN
jgi:hypothetical protein